MGLIRVTGSLTVGPPCACDGGDSSYGNGVSNIGLSLFPCPKSSQVDTGVNRRMVNSPTAFIPLSGVGPSDNVTQGDTLYVRSVSPVLIQVTFYNPNLPMTPWVSVIPLQGMLLIEPPQNSYVMGLAVQGTGQIEYLVSGQQ
jgi:hypothetical protein